MSEQTEHTEVKIGSDRNFGFFFAAVFLIVGLWPLMDSGLVRWWSLGLAAALVFLIMFWTAPIRPLNVAWFKFGLLLGRVIAPVVMAVLFILVVFPTGLIMRALGKDLLRKKMDRNTPSYWITREEPVRSMKDQF
jgi:predicted membrane metal-binding protein